MGTVTDLPKGAGTSTQEPAEPGTFDASDAPAPDSGARAQLQMPVGGADPDRALLQVTGGAVEIPPATAPAKGARLNLRVSGYVKTVKFSDRREGGEVIGANREAVFVVESVEIG